MGNLIIAGNGNTIPPEMDALFRDVILYPSEGGQNLIFTKNGSTVTINGIVFAFGVIGYCKNVTITGVSEGGIYVDLTTYQNPQVQDVGNIYFSATVPPTQGDDISANPGTYRFRVAHIDGSGNLYSDYYYEKPRWSTYASKTTEVLSEIASGAIATTQNSSDRSRKVATTAFVHNLIDGNIIDSYLSAPNFTINTNVCYNRFGLIGIKFSGTYVGTQASPAGTIIASVPGGYRPSSSTTVPCWFTIFGVGTDSKETATINTVGNIVLNYTIGPGDQIELNCCFLKS